MNKKSALAAGTAIAGLALATAGAAPAAYAAQESDVDVVNTETVQVYISPDGDIESQRVYEQLALTGTGPVTLSNPIEENGLRNLDGFAGFSVEDGKQNLELDVDGSQRVRSVSNYTGPLPLDIRVEYRLDGSRVEPSDVVGADGELQVLFTVTNQTAEPQVVSYPDGRGGTTSDTADVPIPMVGSLTTIAPSNFTEVRSDQANIAGDGKGGTKLTFTMTLFPPLGSDEIEFGYTARIEDGVVPAATASALPVNPLKSPSFKTAGESYQAGADTGTRLADGATEIDTNLLALQAGAGELLAGLIKLRNGADQLNEGLAGEAAPGAQQLADGAVVLKGGLDQIDDGAGQLADGAGRASSGGRELAGGASRLSDGLQDLDAGAGELGAGADQLAAGQKALLRGLRKLRAGVDALPDSVQDELRNDPQFNALLGALQSIADGVGTLGDGPGVRSLLGGVKKLEYGLDNPLATDGACDSGDATRCGVTDALERIGARLAFSIDNTDPRIDGTVAKLKATILSIKTPPVGSCDAGCQAYVDGVANGVATAQEESLTQLKDGVLGISNGIHSQILADGAGLDQLRAGLSTGADPATCQAAPDSCGIREAALFLQLYGVPALVQGVTEGIRETLLAGIGSAQPGCDPGKTLLCGAAALVDGGGQLSQGMDQLVSGVVQLNQGGALLADGAGELSSGLGELATGAGKLADGTGEASDGSGRLADGAGELASGLGDAADGSGKLAGGLGEAADGAPQIVDGAGRLSEEGMSQLIEAGEATAQDYGKLYAVIEAGAQRADTENMAYGAPENAEGLTAYTFELLGDDGEDGRNTARGLGALGVLALGAGAVALRRRFI